MTCGSVLKIKNTKYDHRLHSHEVKYGSGSGQQSVTAVDTSDDHNSYWQIRPRNGALQCVRGYALLSVRLRCSSRAFTKPLSNAAHQSNAPPPFASSTSPLVAIYTVTSLRRHSPRTRRCPHSARRATPAMTVVSISCVMHS